MQDFIVVPMKCKVWLSPQFSAVGTYKALRLLKCQVVHYITSVDAGASLGTSLRKLAAAGCSVYSNAQIPQRRQ